MRIRSPHEEDYRRYLGDDMISHVMEEDGVTEIVIVLELQTNHPQSFHNCGIVRVFRQHNSLQCDRCAQQSIEGAPTGGKALPTEALVHSP